MNRIHVYLTFALLGILLFGASCAPDPAEQLARFSDSPTLLVGGFGEEKGRFRQLGASTIDSDGNIIAADNELRRITWFDLQGNVTKLVYYTSEDGTPTLPGIEPPYIQALESLNNDLYVVARNEVWIVREDASTRIELKDLPGTLRDFKLSPQGDRLYALTDNAVSIHDAQGNQTDLWELEGELAPGSRAMAVGPNGLVYVSARRWRRVVVFNLDGSRMSTIGRADAGEFSGAVRGIAVDQMGNVFVFDEGEGAVKAFDALGQFHRQIGSKGSAPGETLGCDRIMIDRDRERLVLADSKNYRLQVFDLTGADIETTDLVRQSPVHPPTAQPDHVTLTLGENPLTERRVAWRTDTSTTGSQVEVQKIDSRAAVDSLNWDSSKVLKYEGVSGEFHSNVGPYAYHEATMSGLRSGGRYAYRVGNRSSGSWSEPQAFDLPPDPDTKIKAVVLGDSRNRMDVWSYIVNTSARERPSFIINTGDLVSDGDNMSHWNAWFYEARDVFSRIPLMPCLGNHERQSPNYFNSFALPRNPNPELSEQTYSFDYGPAHWIVLNTEIDLDIQTEWLAQDLKANTKPWVFAFFHRPAYAGHPSRGDGNEDVREAWSPLFDRYGVDIAWQGHDHYYFRTKPVLDTQVVNEGEGPVYVTTGGAGAPLYPIQINRYAEVAESVDHFCVLDVTPKRAEVKVYRADGTLLDEFSLNPRASME